MLKRCLVLAFGLVLFVTAFFIHQYWFDATQVEGKFRTERENFHVEGVNLVSTTPPGPEPMTPTPPPLPVVATPASSDSSSTAAPAPSPAATPTSVPLDSNTLIVPTPAPTTTPAATPDANTPGTTPTPAVPSTNSTPDSTMIYPGMNRLPLLLLGGYATQPRVQATDAASAPAATPAPAVSADTNAAADAKPAPAPTEEVNVTNGAPAQAAPITESKGGKNAISAIIFLYHQFTPPGVRAGPKFMWTMPQDVFAYEMKYLHDNHFNVVPLADVIAFAKGEKQLPPNAVVLTFDDGYKSPLVFAKPILDSYKFPWTFFVYPAFIGNHPTQNYKGAASWPELVELQKEGVDIECHSMTHPNLKSTWQIWPPDSKHPHRLTPEEYDAFLTNEIVTSKQIIEKQLGKTVTCFAYPFGEYNLQVQSKAIAAGYEAIFTVAGNPIHVGTPLKSMGRYTMTTPVEKMFTAYLNQRSLILANIAPTPGETVTDPRPVISAELRYAGSIKTDSISAEVSSMGEVKTDFDPKSSTLRLYLPRDLVAPTVLVDVRAKDADTGKTVVASWRFAYQATAPGLHPPIGTTPAKVPTAATNAAAISTPTTAPEATTNAPAVEVTGQGVTIPLTNSESATDTNAAPTDASNAAPMTQ